jgi:hypothetical protein
MIKNIWRGNGRGKHNFVSLYIISVSQANEEQDWSVMNWKGLGSGHDMKVPLYPYVKWPLN